MRFIAYAPNFPFFFSSIYILRMHCTLFKRWHGDVSVFQISNAVRSGRETVELTLQVQAFLLISSMEMVFPGEIGHIFGVSDGKHNISSAVSKISDMLKTCHRRLVHINLHSVVLHTDFSYLATASRSKLFTIHMCQCSGARICQTIRLLYIIF